jgi:hypothetical protein
VADAEELEVLRSIDAKLGALVTIILDDYIRSHSVPGAKEKPVEVMLHDAGLSTAEIANLLGKTQRAVQIALKR